MDQLRSVAASTPASWESECVRPGGDVGSAPDQPLLPANCSFGAVVVPTGTSVPFIHAVLASLFLSWRCNLHKTAANKILPLPDESLTNANPIV